MVKWADEGKHGGMEVNHKPHVWRDTMDMTVNNGELLRLAVDYLKSKGFSVRVLLCSGTIHSAPLNGTFPILSLVVFISNLPIPTNSTFSPSAIHSISNWVLVSYRREVLNGVRWERRKVSESMSCE